MERVQKRKNPPQVSEISYEAVITGEAINPFTPSELKYLEALRDGLEDFEEMGKRLKIKPDSVKHKQGLVIDKMKQFGSIEGGDMKARALTAAVMAGWIGTNFSDSSRPLEPDEFSMLFFLSFGNSKKQAQGMLNMSEEDFNNKFEEIKKAIGVTGYYQVFAWGASRAKIYLKNRAGKGRSSENAS